MSKKNTVHKHEIHDHRAHQSGNNIKVAFFLNLSFTIIEIFGGILTNSMAILSDALHDLGDSISLGVAWYLEKYSEKGPDSSFSYGYGRFSLLGALISSFVLVIGAVLILSQVIPRLLNPQQVHPEGMLGLAVLGIIVNGIAAIRLRKGSTLNEKVASWHLLEDVLGWVAVLIVSIVLLFKDIPILDPILSLLITAFVLYNVVKNLREIMRVFLQGVPSQFSIKDIEKELSNLPDVEEASHTHIWSLEGQRNLLSIHLIVKDETSKERIMEIKAEVTARMEEKGIDHVTVQIDYKEEKDEYGCL